MHFLKHFTVWGLCAIMLGTQPALTYAAKTPAQETDTYSTTKSETKNPSKESSPDDESAPDSPDSKGDSSESSDDTDSGEETSTSSSTEGTTESSSSESETSSSTEAGTGGSTEKTDKKEDTEETKNTSSSESSETSTSSKKAASTSKKEETSSEDSDKDSSSDKKNAKKSSKDEAKNTEDEKELKKLDGTVIDEEESAEKDEDPSAIIPKIYGSAQIVTRDDAEYMGDFVYFNQTDSIWNQNGYQIASAGCGPTSMAVVISSLTDQWVTPVDTTVWAYEHGYYSSAGSAHALIPAISEAYRLNCEGVGTDYASIKKALKKGKPVVALMGPGYFTRKGHFMVLIGIDDDDNVTVADVGSRTRSAYKYALSDIIAQSKSASAGGPFWVISKPKQKKKKAKETVTYTSPQNDYVIYVKDGEDEKSITFHLGDKVSYNGTYGLIVKFENRKAYITGENGEALTTADGEKAIPLSDLRIAREAPQTVHQAVASIVKNEMTDKAAGR